LVTAAGGAWQARPVVLEPRARPQHVAAAGGRAAAATYTVTPADPRAGPSPCHLVLIDLATGVAAGGLPLCAAGERATSLALRDGAPGPIAYVGLWHAPEVATAEASSRATSSAPPRP
jgi:hypothetical protein